MKSYWIRVGPTSGMIGVPMRRRRDTQKLKEDSHVDRGKDWRYAATSQGTLTTANIHQKLDQAGKESSLGSERPLEDTGPADTLIGISSF